MLSDVVISLVEMGVDVNMLSRYKDRSNHIIFMPRMYSSYKNVNNLFIYLCQWEGVIPIPYLSNYQIN